jgi:hypothetical protein
VDYGIINTTKHEWYDCVYWDVILENGRIIKKGDISKDIKDLYNLPIDIFRIKYKDEIIKSVKRNETEKLIYFFRVFGLLFPFKEEKRILYFGTETNLWTIEPISGMEDTGCNLVFRIESALQNP